MKKKILQIGSYPPPMGGVSMRIKVLKEYLIELGHKCVVLRVGEGMKVRAEGCVNITGAVDFAVKVFRYLLDGYVIHMHINGKSLKSLYMALYTQGLSILFFRRAFLTFHAGAQQKYFPKNKNIFFTIMLHLIFVLSRKIICNAQPVKEKIMEYGISNGKIFPIQGFTSRYLRFEQMVLTEEIEVFLQQHDPVLFSYLCFFEEYTVDSFIDVMEELRKQYPMIGFMLVLRVEDNKDEFLKTIKERKLDNSICLSSNLSHDEFLTLVQRTKMYIRTPPDGICSSVLETIALGVPVVASRNECRPAQAILFSFGDRNDMLEKILYVLDNYEEVKKHLKFEGKDSLDEEIELLTGEKGEKGEKE
ncbi:MAG: glycosyltransferase [bacterium]|nr:glycosyltransferase [bacterium]